MLTLTFAGDESGDVSFAFDKGASRYFVIAMIATDSPDELRQVLASVREASGLPVDYEFNFNSLSSAALRQRVFMALAKAKFKSWAVIVDKSELPDAFKVMRRLEFYLFFVTELIQLVPTSKQEGATLILDEYGSAEQLLTELRRFMKARGIPRHFKRVLAKRSKSEPLIQIADLVAGATLRRDAKKDVEAYEFIEPKMERLLEFRG
jgi:hypothetical protein